MRRRLELGFVEGFFLVAGGIPGERRRGLEQSFVFECLGDLCGGSYVRLQFTRSDGHGRLLMHLRLSESEKWRGIT